MESPANDITSSSLLLIDLVKNFRGPDGYIIDVIRRLSRVSTASIDAIPVNTSRDVASLLSKLSTNQLM